MVPVQFDSHSWNGLDEAMKHMARWLARHLGNPELFLWVITRGGSLHPQFEWELRRRLKDDPPSPPLQVLWALLLSGRVKSLSKHHDLYSWADRLKAQGLTPTLRFELRSALAPVVKFSRPYRWPGADGTPEEGKTSVSDIVQWEIVLGTDYAHSALDAVGRIDKWADALPTLLPDATALLRDALDLMRELGGRI
jgi:hypothetical protein